GQEVRTLTDNDFEEISELSELETLEVDGAIEEKGLQEIAKLGKLRTLKLSSPFYEGLDAEGFSPIAKLKLTSLELVGTANDKMLEAISQIHTLEQLIIGEHHSEGNYLT